MVTLFLQLGFAWLLASSLLLVVTFVLAFCLLVAFDLLLCFGFVLFNISSIDSSLRLAAFDAASRWAQEHFLLASGFMQ